MLSSKRSNQGLRKIVTTRIIMITIDDRKKIYQTVLQVRVDQIKDGFWISVSKGVLQNKKTSVCIIMFSCQTHEPSSNVTSTLHLRLNSGLDVSKMNIRKFFFRQTSNIRYNFYESSQDCQNRKTPPKNPPRKSQKIYTLYFTVDFCLW